MSRLTEEQVLKLASTQNIWKVYVRESERGWGSDSWYQFFDSYEEASAWANGYEAYEDEEVWNSASQDYEYEKVFNYYNPQDKQVYSGYDIKQQL